MLQTYSPKAAQIGDITTRNQDLATSLKSGELYKYAVNLVLASDPENVFYPPTNSYNRNVRLRTHEILHAKIKFTTHKTICKQQPIMAKEFLHGQKTDAVLSTANNKVAFNRSTNGVVTKNLYPRPC